MTKLSEFDIPRQTLNWANEAISDFDTVADEFFTRVSTIEFTEIDPQTGHNLFKVKLSEAIPDRLSQKTFEALTHLKNSFDQILFAACCAISRRPKNDIHFPWRSNPIDLDRRLTNPKASIPSEFWGIIRKHEPYPTGEGYTGGSDQIRELTRIANQKHTISLALIGYVRGGRHPDVRGGPVRHFSLPYMQWDTTKNEMTLAAYSGDVEIQNNYKIAFQVVFQEPGPMRNIPARKGLDLLSIKATEVLNDLEAECARIKSG